ncbi:MAG TPA: ABC transporter substrate-binding protein, partial [Anaerolineales bacterium]|nr:ABC transporter substrate-binding protein [Anaerolineales bacterium]
MRKLSILLSLLVAASMILAACGGAAPATEAPTTGEEPTEAPVTEPTEAPTTEEPATSGGPTSKDPNTFVHVTFGEPDNLDPALDYETAGGEILQNVYETLVTYSGNELSVFEPLLAESWELSEDGRTYSFQLHQGIKFHDGA